jgi:hypothetical protein
MYLISKVFGASFLKGILRIFFGTAFSHLLFKEMFLVPLFLKKGLLKRGFAGKVRIKQFENFGNTRVFMRRHIIATMVVHV